MSSDGNPVMVERFSRTDEEEPKEEVEITERGFISSVVGFVGGVVENIEEAFTFGKPTANVTGVHIPHIDHKKAELLIDVLVKNPNPVPIPLVDINYSVESEERKLVSGLIPDPGSIPAHGSETIKIPVVLIFHDIKSTYKDIRPGSIIPYLVKVELIVHIPVLGKITIPLEKTGEIPVPYKPDIDIEKIHFERFSFEETVASIHLKIDNKNDFDLGLKALDYEVWLANVSIGGAQLEKSANIGKRDVAFINLPVTFKPKYLGSSVWHMIRGKATGYSMKGNIEVGTPFGDMKLPIKKEGGTTRLKKNREHGGSGDDE